MATESSLGLKEDRGRVKTKTVNLTAPGSEQALGDGLTPGS